MLLDHVLRVLDIELLDLIEYFVINPERFWDTTGTNPRGNFLHPRVHLFANLFVQRFLNLLSEFSEYTPQFFGCTCATYLICKAWVVLDRIVDDASIYPQVPCHRIYRTGQVILWSTLGNILDDPLDVVM